MDPLHNPFAPGAGTPPPELAGRTNLLDQALLAFARVKRGRPEKSLVMIGLRGTGKTVLLRQFYNLALQEDYRAMMLEAHDNKTLAELLLPELRRILFELDVGERVSAKVKKAFRVLKSFLSSFKVDFAFHEFNLGLDIDPEKGVADSGDLEVDLASLFVAIGDAAKDRNTAVAIIIDELQYFSEKELSALIMAQHKVSQHALPVILFGAGLPQLAAKMGDSKSYSERLFDFPELTSLSVDDAKSALQDPVLKEKVKFTKDALNEIVRVTKGYPYFLQEWGYQAWNCAKRSPIGLEDAKQSTLLAIARLDNSFFQVRFDRLTLREKSYLSALAQLGAGDQRTGDVAGQLGIESSQVATLRSVLIKKGMIYSPRHGFTAFTVPLFDEFMKRIMPNLAN